MEGTGSTGSSPLPGSSHTPPPECPESRARLSGHDVAGTDASLTASVSQQHQPQAESSDQGGAAEPGLSAPSVPKRNRSVVSYVITVLRVTGLIVATPLLILGSSIAASLALACFMSEYQCLENTTTPRNNICAALKGLGAGVLGVVAGGLVIGPGVALCGAYLSIRNIIAGRPACYTEDTEDEDLSSDAPADEASRHQEHAEADEEESRGAIAIMRMLVQHYYRRGNPFALPMDVLPMRPTRRNG